MKIWDLKAFNQATPGCLVSLEENIEPYITLRGHTGPLFTMCGAIPQGISETGTFDPNCDERILYTAGSEGVVRVWRAPEVEMVIPYGNTYDGRNYCLGALSAHNNEPIWDLQHHPYHVKFIFLLILESIPIGWSR